ncbi:MAG: GDSL-type esterase/lipase family protein [Actinomycetota bacterium]|nr:GDSL-type esterase/lipase family protein [Actinomycetota bacterium]
MPRVLLLADSLAFHGPVRPELLTDPRIYPNVMAQALGAEVDVVAQVGWTARHVWRSLTRDPRVYSFLVPSADAVILAVGGMDYLPTALPTHLREGIGFLRPAWIRRGVRRGYLIGQPRVARWTRGGLRSLPQSLTDRYLANCVSALRMLRPGLPIIGILPPPHRAAAFGFELRGHARACRAARAWGAEHDVPLADLPAVVGPHLAAGRANPDGLHFGWECHRDVGVELARVLRSCADWPDPRRPVEISPS